MNIQIFYSWQSVTSTNLNKNFILSCINKAVKKVGNIPSLKEIQYVVLEGIGGEPGSPSLADKIIDDRIPSSDIFIADLSVVNHLNGLKRAVSDIFRMGYRPMQNNNVMIEHGVALNALGPQRIIGVSNAIYGSPKDNPENITFDLRHMRFPIEYKYSKASERENVQKYLVGALAAAIRDCSLEVLSYQRSKFSPFINWKDWHDGLGSAYSFLQNEKYNQLRETVIDLVGQGGKSIRMLGLSGLGKTRSLLEIFRPGESEESILLSSRVLYINNSDYPQIEYALLLNRIIAEKTNFVLVVDNCSKDLHRLLSRNLNTDDSGMTLITVDSNPEEFEVDRINGVNYLRFTKEELTPVVDDILNRDFTFIDKEIVEKIREFSQGIPLMAVLLAESVQQEGQFHGTLTDKELLDKLLGPKGRDQRSRNILKSCALFSTFGYYEELASESEFIAKSKNLTSIEGDGQVLVNDFYEVCNFYLRRQIFEKRGRLIGMRPFPLAISLAQEWLDPCTPGRLLEVIQEIANLPEGSRKSLSAAFSEQMRYLGHDQKAIEIVERITGPDSPFDNAEVLDTELGSRFFRSFVEVNPIAISRTIVRVFGSRSIEELREVKEGRRNLVWVLESLCFDKRTFFESAKMLFRFAVAENESILNNATGQLLQLFSVYLAGTEVDLNERVKVLEWAFETRDPDFHQILLSAYRKSFNYKSAQRLSGAERQGTRVLLDYQPEFQEVLDYWSYMLERLTYFIKYDSQFSDTALDILSSSIVPIYRYGGGEITLRYLNDVAIQRSDDWDSALLNLRSVRKFSAVELSEYCASATDELIRRLTKEDLVSRYMNLNSTLQDETGRLSSFEKYVEHIDALAVGFAGSEPIWNDLLVKLLTNNIPYPFYFGQRVFETIGKDEQAVKKLLQVFAKVLAELGGQDFTISLLVGFVSSLDEPTRQGFYQTLLNDPGLKVYLFSIISMDSQGDKHFDYLFKSVESDFSLISNFRALSSGRALYDADEGAILRMAEKLFSFGTPGYEVAFLIVSDLVLSERKDNTLLEPILKNCIIQVLPNLLSGGYLNDYRWVQIMTNIISRPGEAEFAVAVLRSLVDQIEDNTDFFADFPLQQLFGALIANHFHAIWPDLSGALLASEEHYLLFFKLKSILGSHIGGAYRRFGILFSGDLEEIFSWCDAKRPLAPARLAEMAPVFSNDNRDYSNWHPIVIRLLDEFGDIPQVLDGLGANLGTFSWSGSILPFLSAKLLLFQGLQGHKFELVRNWASRYVVYTENEIQQEDNREQERFGF